MKIVQNIRRYSANPAETSGGSACLVPMVIWPLFFYLQYILYCASCLLLPDRLVTYNTSEVWWFYGLCILFQPYFTFFHHLAPSNSSFNKNAYFFMTLSLRFREDIREKCSNIFAKTKKFSKPFCLFKSDPGRIFEAKKCRQSRDTVLLR